MLLGTGGDLVAEATQRERISVLELQMAHVERRLSEVKGGIDAIEAAVQGIASDMHAAKVGGKWLLAALMTSGSLVGFLLKVAIDAIK